jgi:myo-inositol-1(or 4)-monophosphatase
MHSMPGSAVDAQSLQDIETQITDLVRQAGQIALEHFRLPLEVKFKNDNRSDPVTQADKGIEEYLRTAITERFPGHAIIGEEGTEIDVEQHDFLWALDPVDGTTNFMNGLPLFGCSAGLLFHGEPVVGAIFLPVVPSPARTRPGSEGGGAVQLEGGVLHARLGGGAFLDEVRVHTSDAPNPEPSSLVGLPGHHSWQFRRSGKLRRNPGELRCLGSVCYETGMVACGVFRYAIFRSPRLWDMAAGVTIVREAGGSALRWNGTAWEPLDRFEPMSASKKPGETSLRHWTGTVLVGGSESAAFVAARLRPGRTLLTRLGDRIANLVSVFQRP